MKAVLVIDMPKSCRECMFSVLGEGVGVCSFYETIVYLDTPPEDFCPLKPLPEEDDKEEYFCEWSRGYQAGWNDCIGAIVGDEND